MYYANCEWYVDMGKHNKPLCERKGLRPAECSECPVYIGSIKAENAKLRRLVRVYRACHDHINACRGCSEMPDCEALEDMQTIGSEVGIEAYDA